MESSVSITLAANVENLVLTSTGSTSGTGNELANMLTGNSGANTLDGGAGKDKLYGEADDDEIDEEADDEHSTPCAAVACAPVPR